MCEGDKNDSIFIEKLVYTCDVGVMRCFYQKKRINFLNI